MSDLSKDRKIIWIHVLTVVSAAVLIGAEVFGAAFAGSWALANLFGLGPTGALILDIAVLAARCRGDVSVHPRRAEGRAVHDARLIGVADRHAARKILR